MAARSDFTVELDLAATDCLPYNANNPHNFICPRQDGIGEKKDERKTK
jgi:hypothetical protein